MLNIFYGDMPGAMYNTASYFKYNYEFYQIYGTDRTYGERIF